MLLMMIITSQRIHVGVQQKRLRHRLEPLLIVEIVLIASCVVTAMNASHVILAVTPTHAGSAPRASHVKHAIIAVFAIPAKTAKTAKTASPPLPAILAILAGSAIFAGVVLPARTCLPRYHTPITFQRK